MNGSRENHMDDWLKIEEGDVARRLRSLHWPNIPGEIRERCWEDFMRRVDLKAEQSQAEEAAHVQPRAQAEAGEDLQFSHRRRLTNTPVISERMSAAARSSRVTDRRIVATVAG
jgi:hypothetical protein